MLLMVVYAELFDICRDRQSHVEKREKKINPRIISIIVAGFPEIREKAPPEWIELSESTHVKNREAIIIALQKSTIFPAFVICPVLNFKDSCALYRYLFRFLYFTLCL